MSDMISRQFEEIIVEHPEITDKEHKGKPYYSIKYVEDREKYIGYGTYKIEVLSSYIRDYFIPPAEPERLTDDDFETIRIHLNAQKEKLCNQQRWEEAEEYQRIIDRFMAFASAEPERKTAEWIYGENGGQDGWYCSKCGLFIPWDYEYYGLDNIDFIADFHTCPKCDRKMLKYTGMRGEQDE